MSIFALILRRLASLSASRDVSQPERKTPRERKKKSSKHWNAFSDPSLLLTLSWCRGAGAIKICQTIKWMKSNLYVGLLLYDKWMVRGTEPCQLKWFSAVNNMHPLSGIRSKGLKYSACWENYVKWNASRCDVRLIGRRQRFPVFVYSKKVNEILIYKTVRRLRFFKNLPTLILNSMN